MTIDQPLFFLALLGYLLGTLHYPWDKGTILAVCQMADGKKISLDEESDLYEMTEKVDHDKLSWGLFTISGSLKKKIEKLPVVILFPALKDITNCYIGVTYHDKIYLVEGNLFTAKEESLKDVTTTLNSIKNMMKLYSARDGEQNADTNEVMAIIDKILISREKESVKISFTVTKEELDSLSDEEETTE